jgi:cobaltochelatase CobN
LELAATVDYIFGFDATAQIAPDFVYEGLAEHYAWFHCEVCCPHS